MASRSDDKLIEDKATNPASGQLGRPLAADSPVESLALRPAAAEGNDTGFGEYTSSGTLVEDLVSPHTNESRDVALAQDVARSESADPTVDLNPSNSSNNLKSEDGHNVEGSFEQDVNGQDPEKKKKKKKKSSGKNKKPPPSGFEEYYADPPLTTHEYNEERHDIYHPSRTFVERIELCIQRYRARRKLDEFRANVFSKYLALGGLDSGIKAFSGGFDQEMLEKSTAAEIAAVQATEIVGRGRNRKYYDPADTVNWVVDFEGVVKGFLSDKAPRTFGMETQEVVSGYCAVIRNFLNYVLAHEVCPEYNQNITAARKICDVAEKELWAIKQISKLLPGDFNMAASTLCGGYYGSLYIGNSWSDEPGPQVGMTIAEAQRVFMTAIALVGTKSQGDKIMTSQSSGHTCMEILKSEIRAMEIIKITMPDNSVFSAFEATRDLYGIAGNIKSIGFLEIQHWENLEAEDEDLTDDEEKQDLQYTNEIFWVEGEVLEHCFVGMKFVATVHELNVGVKFFDSVTSIHCSFFTVLPSSRLDGWKEPIPNTRPAPSVDNPNCDDPDEATEDQKDTGLD